jgi:hypothetical protein
MEARKQNEEEGARERETEREGKEGQREREGGKEGGKEEERKRKNPHAPLKCHFYLFLFFGSTAGVLPLEPST